MQYLDNDGTESDDLKTGIFSIYGLGLKIIWILMDKCLSEIIL